MNTAIVIPGFNEEKMIGKVVADLLPRYPVVVFVDDGSQDHSADVARAAGAHVFRHIINRGQGAGLKTGIDAALRLGADIIVTFDADGQHDVDEIDRLTAPIREGKADITLGSRFLRNTYHNMPMLRKFVLKAAVIFTRITSGLRVTDTHNGLRALSQHAAKSIHIYQDRMAHASEIFDEIRRNKLRYLEVPVTISYTEYSQVKGQSTSAFAKILFRYLMGKIIR